MCANTLQCADRCNSLNRQDYVHLAHFCVKHDKQSAMTVLRVAAGPTFARQGSRQARPAQAGLRP
jgi:hypothetical protein